MILLKKAKMNSLLQVPWWSRRRFVNEVESEEASAY